MYKGDGNFAAGEGYNSNHTILEIKDGAGVLDDVSYVRDADLSRNGSDLLLDGPDGTIVVEGYFSADTPPVLTAPDGSSLTPGLVDSFLKSAPQYAQAASMSDESPVGSVQEFSGHATVTHIDGSSETITLGTRIYEGDIIETGGDGAVNISFVDETNFAVSENARLAIDEYVFDPSTSEGSTDFSVLKGLFVFTSGLIGRADPDDVTIDTPMGSIGIRGTIIAGNVDSGEITVVEGAIVLHDLHGHEITLASQFETAKFSPGGGGIEHIGQLSANDVTAKFSSISTVSGGLFSSIGDAAHDAAPVQTAPDANPVEGSAKDPVEEKEPTKHQPADSEKTKAPGSEDEAARPEAQESDASHAPKDVPPQEGQIQKTAQVMEQRFDGMQNKLMNGHGSGHENLMTLKAAQHTLTDLKHAMQMNTQLGENKLLSGQEPLTNPLSNPNDGTTVNPNIYNNNTAINHAPYVISEAYASNEYYRAGMQQNWTYDFNHEFRDIDHNPLHFTLESNSHTMLNSLKSSNFISSWNFDSNTGILTVNAGSAPLFGNQTLNLNIFATDGLSPAVGITKAFTLVKTTALTGSNNNNSTVQNLQEVSTGDIGTSGQNKTVFLKESAGTSFTVNGDNNTVYIGEHTNRTVNLSATADNNLVIGGSKGDRIDVHNSNAKIEGMDGDDVVLLHINETAVTSNLGSLSVNLGEGLLSYAHVYKQGGDLGAAGLTHGDAIELNGAGSIDFSNIDSLKGIETIQARDATAQSVMLTHETVFDMTEAHKTLIFQGDGSDTLTFDDSDGASWSDTGESVTFAGETYDVWESVHDGQIVTVLVDSDVTAAVV